MCLQKRKSTSGDKAGQSSKRQRPDEVAAAEIAARIAALNQQVENARSSAPQHQDDDQLEDDGADVNNDDDLRNDVAGLKETVASLAFTFTEFMNRFPEGGGRGNQTAAGDGDGEGSRRQGHDNNQDTQPEGPDALAVAQAYQILSGVASGQSQVPPPSVPTAS